MITDGQKNTPAPWVPFTRAGCDVGGVGTANIELENASTAATGDITKVFGTGSPEWNESGCELAARRRPTSSASRSTARRRRRASAAATRTPSPIRFPDEPGGYTGYNALYGTKYVDPAITGGNACVNDTTGDPITDPVGNCGFPGFDGMLAKNTLGYVAAMQESGVPVTYGYISDAHDSPRADLATDSYFEHGDRPGRDRRTISSCALRQRLRGVLQGPAGARHQPEQHALRRSPSTRATTSPAAPARRSRTATGSSTTTDVHEPQHVPDEPDRRGRRDNTQAASLPTRRADVRPSLRRRADVLRERAAAAGPTRRVRKLERDVGAV